MSDPLLHRFPMDIRGGAGTRVRQFGGAYWIDIFLGELSEPPADLVGLIAVGVDPTTGLIYRLNIPGISAERTPVADHDYAIQGGDRYVAMTALSGARTLTLPRASQFSAGPSLYVADESGACSVDDGRTVVVAAQPGDTIAGQASVTLVSPYQKIVLHSNGSNLWTFA